MKNTQKGFIVPLLIAIIAVLAIGGGVYVFEQSKPQQNEQQPIANDQAVSTSTNQTTTSANSQTAEWKTYTNSQYAISFQYPTNFNLKTVNLQDGALIDLELNTAGSPDYVYVGIYPDAQKLIDISDKNIICVHAEVSSIKLFSSANHYACGDAGVEENRYITKVGNVGLMVSFVNDQEVENQKHISKELFDQILSTFKFTATSPIINTSQAINISSPKSGDVLKVSSTYQIAWKTSNIPVDSVGYIILKNNVEGGDLYVINRSVALNGGSVSNFGGTRSWTVPNSALVPPGNKYTVRIGIGSYDNDYYHGGKYFESGIFAISNSVPFLPTTCIDQQIGTPGGIPVITSLSSNSGPVGTMLEIAGCNFNGFESDLNVWIENSQGVKGILYSEPGSTFKLMKVILKPQACQTDESYRGSPCASYLNLVPGIYKIYTAPYGNKSNEATFTIK